MESLNVDPTEFSSSTVLHSQQAESTSTGDVAAAVEALRARHVSNPESFLSAATPDAIMGACRWYDEQKGRVGTGILVMELRAGGKPGYGEAAPAMDLPVTQKLLASIRGRCLSSDGAWRGEVQDTYEMVAKKRGLTVDALLDQAIGPHWQVTPPHPAVQYGVEGQPQRYNRWLMDKPQRPDLSVSRQDGESVFDWACRFWRWDKEEA